MTLLNENVWMQGKWWRAGRKEIPLLSKNLEEVSKDVLFPVAVKDWGSGCGDLNFCLKSSWDGSLFPHIPVSNHIGFHENL